MKKSGYTSRNGDQALTSGKPVRSKAGRVSPSKASVVDRPAGRTSYVAGCKTAGTNAK